MRHSRPAGSITPRHQFAWSLGAVGVQESAVNAAAGETHVYIRGERLRHVREAAGLRLEDVAEPVMHFSTLSRLETHGMQRLRLSTVCELIRQFGIHVQPTVCPAAWARAITDQAMELYIRGELRRALWALELHALVVEPVPPVVRIEAEILKTWVRWLLGEPGEPSRMADLRARAHECGAARAPLWALIFEADMRTRLGDSANGLRSIAEANSVAEHDGEPIDRLCARAAWGRMIAQHGQPEQGLELLNHHRADPSDRPLAYGRARVTHARGLLQAAAKQYGAAIASLRDSATTALLIPNPLLAAYAEWALVNVYDVVNDAEKTDAAAVRAARLFLKAGRPAEAWQVFGHAVKRESLPSHESLVIEWGPCGAGDPIRYDESRSLTSAHH